MPLARLYSYLFILIIFLLFRQEPYNVGHGQFFFFLNEAALSATT